MAATAPGCSGGEDGQGGGGDGCLSNRAYFAQKVWPQVMGKVCVECHSPDGVATEENAKLQLLPSAYPGFLDANYDSAVNMVKVEYDGKSTLLRKPLGELDHGGGVQISSDSAEYAVLAEFVKRVNSGESCGDGVSVASFDDVELLDAVATYRKAALHLTGKLPSVEEYDRLFAEGEAVLPGMVEELTRRPEFYQRLEEIWNDVFLTDRYMQYTGYALNVLNDDMYPQSDEYYDSLADDDKKREINEALAREPLKLISHIVRNDKPFTEVLTADYTVVNPFSEQIYQTGTSFDDPNNPNEWKEARVTVQLESGPRELPHAGVLTNPMWLNRFPTTPTNRNRHRARMVFKFFLATDILRVAERPIDPLAATQYNNPTRDDPGCNGCHRQIDPIAGAFMKWDENDQEEYEPDNEWHQEMFPPGFGKEVMPVDQYVGAQQWLAQRMTGDSRFSLSMVYTMFAALTGHDPLTYPEDVDAADYSSHLKAWEAQEQSFRAIVEKFEADNYNLRTIIREIIISPYYRAANAKSELSDARASQLRDVGTGRLSTPELLERKVEAVTGAKWARGWDRAGYLSSDYEILYGGIDSDTVTDRLTAPNGVMANVARRMANEVSCSVTAWDFTKPADQRRLFPDVSLEDVPETESGDPVPAAVERIKENIRYLHAHVLGESLEPGDAELERTYTLFYDTWKEGAPKVASDELSTGLPWQCRGRTDASTGEDLPDDQQINNDENYAVRSWMAVMTYLLSDYRFLYE